ncbi:MAG: 2-C-methyl-D-erythritol 2,4-cyclodiphosphate synthase [Terriglobia bacterium]
MEKPRKTSPPSCCPHRTGFGNDVHRLEAGRALVLGGVRIPFSLGPAGHSDGDALAHAVCDALLGAAALGDIGTHFPDTSRRWHNASSLTFLRQARALLKKAGYRIVNLDATISLERPKLAPYIFEMRNKLAQALGVSVCQVSVKAKTGEGKDAVGRGEAIRADAIALIEILPSSLHSTTAFPRGRRLNLREPDRDS